MAKLKTNKGAAKRFRVAGSGKIKRRRTFRSHILTKKTPKWKRHMRKLVTLKKCDARSAASLLKIK